MPTPRYKKVNTDVTPFYHCIARCVRRAFLNGVDVVTGQDFSHRKGWILSRLKLLGSAFAVNVCAYAVMCNHYHLVVHIDTDESDSWGQEQIVQRWKIVFPADVKKAESLSSAELKIKTEEWRKKLSSISWYMRCVNEHIARKANIEDDCKGRFWEGRFQSQALLDNGAVLSAMTYVDLNPIRAGMAATVEDSDFTSIQARVQIMAKQLKQNKELKQPLFLMPFSGKKTHRKTLDFTLSDYLTLVDSTARAFREGKRGKMDDTLPPILTRLGLNSANWLDVAQNVEGTFFDGIGNPEKLVEFSQKLKGCHPKGICAARAFYQKTA